MDHPENHVLANNSENSQKTDISEKKRPTEKNDHFRPLISGKNGNCLNYGFHPDFAINPNLKDERETQNARSLKALLIH